MAVVVILGVQWFVHRNRSEGEKLGDALGERCDHVGLIAAFGGRSSLYRCGFGYESLHCAIWVDGAAYDVTRQAQAIFRLQQETAAC